MLEPRHPIYEFLSKQSQKVVKVVNDVKNRVKFSETKTAEILPHLVSSFETSFESKYKDYPQALFEKARENVAIALRSIDGLLIKSGESFSFWHSVGKPDRSRGFVSGPIFKFGAIELAMGGGLSHLSNLLHWLFLHSELNITERHHHSFDMFADVNRTKPYGVGATVEFDTWDLRASNSTDKDFQLKLVLEGNTLKAQLYSSQKPTIQYKVVEKDNKFIQQSEGVFRYNRIYREVTDAAGSKTEFVFDSYGLCRYPTKV